MSVGCRVHILNFVGDDLVIDPYFSDVDVFIKHITADYKEYNLPQIQAENAQNVEEASASGF